MLLPPPHSTAGLASFVIGAIALLLVLVQFAAGPFASQQRASVTVGEIAAEMREAEASGQAESGATG